MRKLAAAMVLVAACKGGKSADKGAGGAPSAGSGAAAPAASTFASGLPQVSNAAATLLPTEGAPQLVVMVDAAGAMKVAAGPASWAALDAGEFAGKAIPTDRELIYRAIRDGQLARLTGAEVFKELSTPPDPAELEQLAKELAAAQANDPPPPPPEETEDDDDPSGGTGTAMALDEGKMGRKDDSRYQFAKAGDQPGLTRSPRGECSWDEAGAGRRCIEMADVLRDGKISSDAYGYPYSVLAASPKTKVASLRSIGDVAGLIAVGVQGKVRLLRIAFNSREHRDDGGQGDNPWLEVRFDQGGLTVVAPDQAPLTVPMGNGGLDAAALGKAYDEVLAKVELDKRAPVDVLVGAETTMQELVEVIAALDLAGATVIGIGSNEGQAAPSDAGGDFGGGAAAGRAARPAGIPTLKISIPSVQDGGSPTIVARYLKRNVQKLLYCYERVLLSKPALAGTVNVVFTIGTSGAVKDSSAEGVDGEVSACAGGVIKDIEFAKGTKPVDVRAELTYAPTGG